MLGHGAGVRRWAEARTAERGRRAWRRLWQEGPGVSARWRRKHRGRAVTGLRRGVSWTEWKKGKEWERAGPRKRAEVRGKGEGEVGRVGFDWAGILG